MHRFTRHTPSSTVLEPAHSTLARPSLHPHPIDRYGALTVPAASAMAETAGMGETYAVIAATHAMAEAVVEAVADYANTTPGGVETMARHLSPPGSPLRRNRRLHAARTAPQVR
jgi:hypothetical protein